MPCLRCPHVSHLVMPSTPSNHLQPLHIHLDTQLCSRHVGTCTFGRLSLLNLSSAPSRLATCARRPHNRSLRHPSSLAPPPRPRPSIVLLQPRGTRRRIQPQALAQITDIADAVPLASPHAQQLPPLSLCLFASPPARLLSPILPCVANF